MTRVELKNILMYVNKKIEELDGTVDFFYFGNIEVPDPEELERRMRYEFEKKLQRMYEEKVGDPYFRNEVKYTMLYRIKEGIDITIILSHFTKAELIDMEQKDFPVFNAWRKFPLDKNDPKTAEFLNYLEAQVIYKVDNDLVNFLMTHAKYLTNLDFLGKGWFAYDELKAQELKILDSIPMDKKEGISFGTHHQFKIKLPTVFSGLILPATLEHNVSEYLDGLSIADFFLKMESGLNLMLENLVNAVEHSIDKDWTRNYINCVRKDLQYVRYAMTTLDGFQNEKLIEGKIYSY